MSREVVDGRAEGEGSVNESGQEGLAAKVLGKNRRPEKVNIKGQM